MMQLHFLAAFLFCVVPMFGIHWALGVLATFVVLACVEVVHGVFDDFIPYPTP